MDEKIANAVKRTGKKFGGTIYTCRFRTFELDQPFEGRSKVTIATGNLSDDPNERFGFRGNFGMRTSYIVRKTKSYIETRNSIYGYFEIDER